MPGKAFRNQSSSSSSSSGVGGLLADVMSQFNNFVRQNTPQRADQAQACSFDRIPSCLDEIKFET